MAKRKSDKIAEVTASRDEKNKEKERYNGRIEPF